MSDVIARLNAALTGRYAVERELGQGGMATVYLADDVRHKRKVALKVLKPELAAVVGSERFLAEIETTANLQHPHILPLFDSGEADGFLFFVMPYIEGETLRDRIDREKQLPVDEAVGIATAIASALSVAHEQGVIHRDIKPSNILLSRGEPLVMDFGIAIAVTKSTGARLTETGLSVGTPYYMSPEQATGDREITAASDVYALGCVLYEMLVGEPPYVGATAQAVLGKILTEKPRNPTAVRAVVPANVEGAVLQALEKLPADRFRTASGFVRAITDTGFRYGGAAAATTTSAGPWKPMALGFAALSVILAGVLANSGLGPPPSGPVTRHPIEPPAPLERVVVRLSRDGSRIGYRILSPDAPRFTYPGPDDSRIWVRERGVLDLEEVPGTGGAEFFTFSPDGNSIAFTVRDTLKTVSLDGGRPVTVLVDESVIAPDWGDDGYLYLGSGTTERPHVLRVPATGGEATPVPGTEEHGMYFEVPRVLPGSRGMLATAYHDLYDEELTEIWAVDFESGSRHYLANGIRAQYVASGHLVYLTGTGQLVAAGFDLESLQMTTDPIVLEEGLFGFMASDRGDLIAGYGAPRRRDYQVMWVDRDGTMEVLDWTFRPGEANYDPTLSPDGSRVVLTSQQRDSSFLVRTWDLAGGTSQVVAQGRYRNTTWSADGRYIGVIEWGDHSARWVRIRSDGSGEIEPLTEVISWPEEGDVLPGFWSPDDTLFVIGNKTGLAAIRAGTGIIDTLLVTGKEHGQATLSPDGRWVAYIEEDDDPAVAWRLFVRPFPNVNDEKIPVSAGQGYEPRWSRDGRTLYFIRFGVPGVQLLAASVRAGSDFSVLGVEPLFYPQTGSVYLGGGWSYDANADGSRFMAVRRLITSAREERLVLTINFFAELRERVGGNR